MPVRRQAEMVAAGAEYLAGVGGVGRILGGLRVCAASRHRGSAGRRCENLRAPIHQGRLSARRPGAWARASIVVLAFATVLALYP